MENKNSRVAGLKTSGVELIKPRKIEDVYANTQMVEAFCGEFGKGTDCRGVNAAVEADEDSLLF
ncbi:hypothetical protein PQ469_27765 [Mucilaginibacter sp. KACC 22773]|uniref:hypothetical protein n=1 Tax=Mucilaginibacter sp. KACC 22773 TaxID=3025671 RepID=UPI00236603F7|nr:hypothetical protein [Mucilaginibacter sp. KACC 22773]WDF77691.1 hypothetical protein PQ469_27765 [Mucilaginibacter sp. KACC 22773]